MSMRLAYNWFIFKFKLCLIGANQVHMMAWSVWIYWVPGGGNEKATLQ